MLFQSAAWPMRDMRESLGRGAEKYDVDMEVQHALRDVLDHVLQLTDKLESLRAILTNALTVNGTLVTRRQTETALAQNEQVPKIPGWAARLFGPTLVRTIYARTRSE